MVKLIITIILIKIIITIINNEYSIKRVNANPFNVCLNQPTLTIHCLHLNNYDNTKLMVLVNVL